MCIICKKKKFKCLYCGKDFTKKELYRTSSESMGVEIIHCEDCEDKIEKLKAEIGGDDWHTLYFDVPKD